MLVIECPDHLAAVRAFADRHDLTSKLQAQLDYLGNYACHGDPERTRCRLFSDRAPQSFSFLLERCKADGTYEPMLHGGMIFYGPADGGTGAPQFSVSLGGEEGARWEIHT